MLGINGYILHEEIYKGTFIEVFRATRVCDNKPVILKRPHSEYPSPKELALLQHEYDLLKNLHIPNVIQVYDFIKSAQQPILVFEDMAGMSLESYLARKPLELDHFFSIALQLVDIITELHKQNIIHKDINPGNIIIDPTTLKIKITDLSISCQLTEQIQEYVNTNLLEGTYAYIAPEQTGRINRTIDYRVDFYSLGITLFEMLTGTFPFKANDSLEWVHCHIAKPAPLACSINKNVPEMLSMLVNKLLSKMPEDRYMSTHGIKSDLNKCMLAWNQSKTIPSFQLGTEDIDDHLHISHKLYGRDKEIKKLLLAFERSRYGGAELILVSGYSGIGKTTLVKEIYQPLAIQHGYFIHGKFDLLQRGTPYSAVIMALQSLVKQILAESDNILAKFCEELILSLDQIGQVIIDVIPEVERIIGPQPAPPVLNAKETQNRFNFAMQKFIHVFAKSQHQLVIFIDDLQWADLASLEIIENLLTDTENHYFLIIGAYRDNEIHSDHPLNQLIKNLEKKSKQIQNLVLRSLDQEDICNLLKDTFSCSIKKAYSLAKLLQEKTEGNPFYINEFINNLYEKKLIYFDHNKTCWEWDANIIKREDIAPNVVQLLTNKIETLPENEQLLLKKAACIGYKIDFRTLININDNKVEETAFLIWELVKKQIIHPLDDAYNTLDYVNSHDESFLKKNNLQYIFSHDRIQHAVYELIPKHFKMKMHYAIAMYLIPIWEKSDDDESLFLLMDHINNCYDILTNANERKYFGHLSLIAGEKAKNSGAFYPAINYLDSGIKLLADNSWKSDYELTKSLYMQMLECKYLTGNIIEAHKCSDILLKYTKTNFDKAVIYSIKAISYASVNKLIESVDCNIEALRFLSINIPLKPSFLRVMKEFISSEYLLSRKKISILSRDLKELKDPKELLVAKIFNDLGATTHLINEYLYAVIICVHFKHMLKNGYSSCSSPMHYGCFLITGFRKYKKGLLLGDLAMEFDCRLGNQRLSCSNQTGLAWIMGHFKESMVDVLTHCEKAIQLGMDIGELVLVSHCQILKPQLKFFIGCSLEEVFLDSNRLIKFLDQSRTGDYEERYVVQLLPLLIQYLQGAPNFQYANINNIIEAAEKTNFIMLNIEVYLVSVIAFYIMGSQRDALYSANKGYKLHYRFPGTMHHVFLVTFSALTFAKYYNSQGFFKKILYRHRIKSIIKLLNQYQKFSSINYSCHYYLISAELARIENNSMLAMSLYGKAFKSAKSLNNSMFIAIIHERLFEMYVECEDDISATKHFEEAYHLHKLWGAHAKCNKLILTWPDLYNKSSFNEELLEKSTVHFQAAHQSTSVDLQKLDLLAILKSTQAIASEIELNKLLQKLIQIVLQDTGAQRAILILNKNDIWQVEAEGSINSINILLHSSNDIDKRNDLPLTLIQYVKRTSELLISDNAANEEFFSDDPFIVINSIKSILLMPIINQGQLKRILYLENNINTAVFTPRLLQTLQLLASQAVISLENASLYYEATHDLLTGLANRNLLYQTFTHALLRAKRANTQIAILFMDLDHFKTINDTLGHDIGDKLLQFVAEKIKYSIGENDLAVRLGGDEFVVMLENIDGTNMINNVVQRFYDSISIPILIDEHELEISSSMGISIYPMDGEDIQTLLKNADKALYQAKESGRNCFCFNSEFTNAIVQHEHDLKYELQQAIQLNQLCLYYQPIFELTTGRILGLEALLRWKHPRKGVVSPIDIIACAEKSDLILAIGNWVLREACVQLNKWKKDNVPIFPIAVNISALQLKSTNKSLSVSVEEILKETQVDPSYLELELTESEFIDNSKLLIDEMRKLRKMGLRLNIDDFGVGYSNIGYLKRLPISKIKIDQSFIQEINNSEDDRVIMKAIVTMANQLKLKVIVEGVEDFSQYQFLKKLHVDGVQGYYLQHPMDEVTCRKFLIDKGS